MPASGLLVALRAWCFLELRPTCGLWWWPRSFVFVAGSPLLLRHVLSPMLGVPAVCEFVQFLLVAWILISVTCCQSVRKVHMRHTSMHHL